MKIQRLSISNFRGVSAATLHFNGHSLLIGGNNVGKSTVCEAIDLVLGPDRLGRFSPVDEFDFYNTQYLEEDGVTPIPIRIEVLLVDLTEEVARQCRAYGEYWYTKELRLLEEGEVDLIDDPNVKPCLRIETVAHYDLEEDEFVAETYFSFSPSEPEEGLHRVSKRIKRLFGFLYLRTIRTGSRALSLERGSLLDIILRLQDVRTGLWEKTISRLRDLDPPIDEDADELKAVLESIEDRLSQYITTQEDSRSTHLFVSQLTREHLRKTLSFFLKISADQNPVPFQRVGTGTLNTLVLALLSFIADIKKENVIFAMEEPEIALPPHTQRRIANYLLNETTQCFVTSHSPYVIERFSADQILILRRSKAAELSTTPVPVEASIKEKMFKRFARRGLAEAMLGPGVIVAEGLTELAALTAVSAKLEAARSANYPLDLSGITVFPVDGDGAMANFGQFFKLMGLKTFAFYDKKTRRPEDDQKLIDSFDHPYETKYTAIEKLLIEEVPVAHQWTFLEEVRKSGEQPGLGIPEIRPDDNGVRAHMAKALKSNKGNGYAGRLLDLCDVIELPGSITEFLNHVYQAFPKPQTEFSDSGEQGAAADNAGTAQAEPAPVAES